LIVATASAAQTLPAGALGRDIRAVRTERAPTIDGHLTDDGWASAQPATSFTQRDPDEGKAPTERTEVRFLFDDDALYIGARLYDSAPVQISRRLSTRDSSADADVLSIYLDPMHDKLTGAIFRISAANVQQDSILYNDTWTDGSWDAVWQSAVSVDEDGWCAEIRIPLSQLRFAGRDQQTWGVNVERYIRRKNERVWLEMVPKNETGLASRMLNMTGLDGIKPTRRLELLPYAAGRTEFVAPRRAGNPFNDGARSFGSAGLDLKLGLTSNLTATATVNPDFGQVEVDPAVVNLTAFETFFQEKRPFFLEGSQIFNNYGRSGSNDFWGFNNSEPQIFYSRRIGRTPQLSAAGDYVDAPTATTILGAAKLTGKTSGGWSIGFLEAVTGEESARTQSARLASRAVVEPLTNYAVARVQRDIGRRAGLGLLSTAVNRQLTTQALRDGLVASAYIAGADGYVFLDDKRDWVIVGNIAGSYLTGTPTVISRLQRAPQRYFQRPDAPHVALDDARRSLHGYTGRININRNGGLWKINSALWAGSPGFESNDLGFHGTGDRAGMHAVFQLRDVTPRRFSRSRSMWISKYWTWNFARDVQSDGLLGQGYWEFLNYWNVNGQIGQNWRALDDRLTRGGPSMVNPGGTFGNANVNTDSRKAVSLNVNGSFNRNAEGGWNRTTGFNLQLKPSAAVSISLGPSLNRQHVVAQYVRSVVDPSAVDTAGGRYVFGVLDQTQLSMTTRVSVIVSPTISVQIYAQPLLAAGDYDGFKELLRTRTYSFLRYGSAASVLAYDPAARSYLVDPDGTGDAASFTFADPDFNLKSLRLNAVFRWELKPGSTFYGVWTRQQQDFTNPGVFSPGRDARAMFGAPGDDVFLVKMAYWIGR
jgi:hypothetical protein